jgi:hypothetical protein
MMKLNKIITRLFVGLTACFVASCTLETSDNGDLDGFWHLVSVDSLSTGTARNTKSLRLFWSIQAKLIDMRDADGVYKECIMHFNTSNDSLRIYDEYLFDRAAGDIKIDSVGYLQPYGVNKLSEGFKIIHLNSNVLKLESKELRLNFEKM